jgi:hypothetical protein
MVAESIHTFFLLGSQLEFHLSEFGSLAFSASQSHILLFFSMLQRGLLHNRYLELGSHHHPGVRSTGSMNRGLAGNEPFIAIPV